MDNGHCAFFRTLSSDSVFQILFNRYDFTLSLLNVEKKAILRKFVLETCNKQIQTFYIFIIKIKIMFFVTMHCDFLVNMISSNCRAYKIKNI